MNQIFNEDVLVCLDRIQDNSIDLMIIDPPYFRVLKREKWDKFKDFNTYMKWSDSYLTKCISKLRLSGTLLLYGCCVSLSTMCSLNDIMIKNGMYFVQEIVINKGIKSMAGRISDKINMCPPVSENIFVYRKDAKPFVKNLLKSKQKEFGLSTKQIKEKLGMPLNGGGNWTKYCGNTEFPLLPTKENWEKICELFQLNIPYHNIEETYNGIFGLSNVWDDINFYIKNRKHPSEKPIPLAERCISIFSNENNTVYIPFAGSGNDIIACIKHNRNYIASEIDKDYYEKIIQSVNEYKNK